MPPTKNDRVGREVDLPLCVWAAKPAEAICTDGSGFPFSYGNACTIDPATSRPKTDHYWLSSAANSLDWGSGNNIYNFGYGICRNTANDYSSPEDFVTVSSEYGGSGATVIAHASGYIQNITTAYVRGDVSWEQDSASNSSSPGVDMPIKAVLQILDGDTWKDVAEQSSYAATGSAEVTANLDPQVGVRVEVRMMRHANAQRTVRLKWVRLFGAECFLDKEHPGLCQE